MPWQKNIITDRSNGCQMFMVKVRPFHNMVSTIWNQMFTGGQNCVTKPPKATFGQSPLDNIHSTLTSANSLSHLNWTWRHNNICLIAHIQISESSHLELEFDLINAHSGVVVQIHSCLHAGVHWHLKQTNKCQNVSLKTTKPSFGSLIDGCMMSNKTKTHCAAFYGHSRQLYYKSSISLALFHQQPRID